MRYAVIKIGGKQYKVAEGDVLKVEKLAREAGEIIELDQVLLAVDGKKVLIGQPLVKKIKVKAKVLKHLKGPKIRVAKFKAKSRYRRLKGHRQEFSEIEVERIELGRQEKKVSGKGKGKKRDS